MASNDNKIITVAGLREFLGKLIYDASTNANGPIYGKTKVDSLLSGKADINGSSSVLFRASGFVLYNESETETFGILAQGNRFIFSRSDQEHGVLGKCSLLVSPGTNYIYTSADFDYTRKADCVVIPDNNQNEYKYVIAESTNVFKELMASDIEVLDVDNELGTIVLTTSVTLSVGDTVLLDGVIIDGVAYTGLYRVNIMVDTTVTLNYISAPKRDLYYDCIAQKLYYYTGISFQEIAINSGGGGGGSDLPYADDTDIDGLFIPQIS